MTSRVVRVAGWLVRASARGGRDPGRVEAAVVSAVALWCVERAVERGGLAGGAEAALALAGGGVAGGGVAGGSAAPGGERPAAEDRSLVAWAVRWAGSGRLATTCLPRSLTVWALLRASGDAAVVRIGAAPGAPAAEVSHAWVEVDGQPVRERDDPRGRYLVLPLDGHYPAVLVGPA